MLDTKDNHLRLVILPEACQYPSIDVDSPHVVRTRGIALPLRGFSAVAQANGKENEAVGGRIRDGVLVVRVEEEGQISHWEEQQAARASRFTAVQCGRRTPTRT